MSEGPMLERFVIYEIKNQKGKPVINQVCSYEHSFPAQIRVDEHNKKYKTSKQFIIDRYSGDVL